MGICVRDCWVCDVCGAERIKEGEEPKRCWSRECRSLLWNRKRKSNVGRPDLSVVKVKGVLPWITANGEHHELCSCMACLLAIRVDDGYGGKIRCSYGVPKETGV